MNDIPDEASQHPAPSPLASAPAESRNKRVGGWLLLFCLGLTVFSPLFSLAALAASYGESSQYFGHSQASWSSPLSTHFSVSASWRSVFTQAPDFGASDPAQFRWPSDICCASLVTTQWPQFCRSWRASRGSERGHDRADCQRHVQKRHIRRRLVFVSQQVKESERHVPLMTSCSRAEACS
jgi:hypothetical protein